MKAVVYREYGNPEVLQLTDIDRPRPKGDELLIRVHAAEVTKADCEMRSFRFPVKWFWLPLRLALGILRPKRQVLGGYFAGIVEQVGQDVQGFAVGQRVFGAAGLRMGAHAEYASLPANGTIVTMPENVGFPEAAAVPLGGLNAIHFMRKSRLAAGETILINGAGGSIGLFAVQIAKALGATVTAVDASHKEELVRDAGADRFLDYAAEHFWLRPERYDVVFNMVAGPWFSRCVSALAPRGRYLMGNPRLMDMIRSVISTRTTDKTVQFAFARETREELLALKAMIESGQIRCFVDQVFPFEKAAEAHRRVESEARIGAIILAARDRHKAVTVRDQQRPAD